MIPGKITLHRKYALPQSHPGGSLGSKRVGTNQAEAKIEIMMRINQLLAIFVLSCLAFHSALAETWVGTATYYYTNSTFDPKLSPEPFVEISTDTSYPATLVVSGSLLVKQAFTGYYSEDTSEILEVFPATEYLGPPIDNIAGYTFTNFFYGDTSVTGVGDPSSPNIGWDSGALPPDNDSDSPFSFTSSATIVVDPVTGIATLHIHYVSSGVDSAWADPVSDATTTSMDATTIDVYLTTTNSSFAALTEPYKALGCQCSDADPGIADPIRIGVGNLYEEIPDYSSKGQNALSFGRYYNSGADSNSVAAALGRNWRSTYDRYLKISTGSVIAERADGQELTFTTNSGSWTSDSDVDVQLLKSGSNWELIYSDDSVETYNSSGLLSSIVARDGYSQTMSYNSSNQLATVTDSFNRKLQLTYHTNLLYTVTAPNGLILTYGYNSSGITPGKLDRLASVTYSTTPTSSQSYVYENASFLFALTGIVDEDGHRYSTWTYDSTGRALLEPARGWR